MPRSSKRTKKPRGANKIIKIHTPKKLHYTIHSDVSESISLENDMEINMLEGNLHVHRFPRLDRFWKHSSVKLEKCQSNCSGWKLPYQFSSRVSKQFSGHLRTKSEIAFRPRPWRPRRRRRKNFSELGQTTWRPVQGRCLAISNNLRRSWKWSPSCISAKISWGARHLNFPSNLRYVQKWCLPNTI